jgi:branched-chain amino acid transport system substrate-binding protein
MAQANLRKELRFVQVLDQGQLVGSASRELAFGSKLVFDEVNARGGLFGRKLELETLDNLGDPRKMAEIIGKLKQRDDVFSLFSIRSTADTVMLAKGVPELPLFCSSSGADPVRKGMPPSVFFLRASWRSEVDRLLGVARNLGVTRIGVVYPAGNVGQAAQALLDEMLAKHGMTLGAAATIPHPASTDVGPAAAQLAASNVQMVVVALAGPAADFMLAARSAGLSVPMYTLSDAITPDFIAKVKDKSRGMGFSSTLPSPSDPAMPIVREYQQAMLAAKRLPKDYSFSSLEGYLNARVLVEALKRMGPDASRERFVDSARNLRLANLGGLTVDFTKGNTGMTFADVFVMSAGGRVMR